MCRSLVHSNQHTYLISFLPQRTQAMVPARFLHLKHSEATAKFHSQWKLEQMRSSNKCTRPVGGVHLLKLEGRKKYPSTPAQCAALQAPWMWQTELKICFDELAINPYKGPATLSSSEIARFFLLRLRTECQECNAYSKFDRKSMPTSVRSQPPVVWVHKPKSTEKKKEMVALEDIIMHMPRKCWNKLKLSFIAFCGPVPISLMLVVPRHAPKMFVYIWVLHSANGREEYMESPEMRQSIADWAVGVRS